MSGIALECQNVTKVYRRSHLGRVTETVGVKDLSFAVRQGEIFALLGLNGAGKTTTLKLFLGLLRADSGEVRVADAVLPDRIALSSLGYLPEVPYFPKHLAVAEVLEYYATLSLGAIPKKILNEKMDAALELVRMQEYRKKLVRECSKGMLQRLSLAQAIVHDPPILIFDEPVTGLDPLGLTEMREIIIALHHKGKTIIFSSHMISEVEKIAHRALILSRGQKVELLEAKAWEEQSGKLERIFITIVRRSGGHAFE